MTDTTVAALVEHKPAQAPTKRKPGPKSAADVPKIKTPTPLVRAACQHLLETPGVTITEVAKMLGCHRVYLTRALKQEHVKDYFAREEKRYVSGAATGARAAHTFVGMLNSSNERVKYDTARTILQERGTLSKPDGRGGHTVNVSVQAGLIIHTRRRAEVEAQAQVIEDNPPLPSLHNK